jgi:hypothetical protein
MKYANAQNTNGSSDPEDKDHKEIIPLWLQGLESNEDTNLSDEEKSSVDTWVKAISKEKPMGQAYSPEHSPNKTEREHDLGTNPDWLVKLSEIDSGLTSAGEKIDERHPFIEDNQPIGSSAPEDALEEDKIKQGLANNPSSESLERINDHAISEDEIELTETLEEVEITDSVNEPLHNKISQDEDLPPWLKEMIADPQEASPNSAHLNQEPDKTDEPVPMDEPTEPLNVRDLSIDKNDLNFDEAKTVEDMEQTGNEFDHVPRISENRTDFSPDMEEEVENDPEVTPNSNPDEWIPENIGIDNFEMEDDRSLFESPATPIEEDTRPIDLTQEVTEEEEEETTILTDDHQEDNSLEEVAATVEEDDKFVVYESEPGPPEQTFEELPEKMQTIKTFLAMGDTVEAIQLIKDYHQKSSYNQELQIWLLEAASTTIDPGIEFWEVLGDIAMENQDHEIAVDAFATAIQSLLKSREGYNGIS